MKVAGVITEYNPFHNGHKYQLDRIREITEADYIVVAMSGNFVQRGLPSICDKYCRTNMALINGADLVLEIPVVWATASAEYFANAGVRLLNSTGCLDYLCFGAENDMLSDFIKYANLLNNEDDSVREKILNFHKNGLTYPAARKNAYKETNCLNFSEEFWQSVSMPNNTLAIEYLRALNNINSDAMPILIPRAGAGYHDTSIDSPLASATAIRQSLISDVDAVYSALPVEVVKLLIQYEKEYGFVHPDEISQLLSYRLLCDKESGFEEYADVTESLSASISKKIYSFDNFMNFATMLKSKNYTHTRITRALIHILLQIKKTDYDNALSCDYVPYMRVLGFKKSASELLHTIKKEAAHPLITKLADASSILNKNEIKILSHDILSSDIYNRLIIAHRKNVPANEFIHGPVII